MGWYIVIKTIKGRQYRYRQRTWREGTRVRTESYSLGPLSGESTGRSEPVGAPANAVKALVRKHLLPALSALRDSSITPPQRRVPWDASAASSGTFRSVPELDALVKATGARIGRSRDEAFYMPKADLIELPEARTFVEQDTLSATEAYYQTLLHELAHWTGHEKRLDRFARSGDLREQRNYAREELVAELTAIVVLKAMGRQPVNLGASAHYFQFWMDKAGDREEASNHAILEAERAAEFLLGFAVNTTKQDVV